MAVVREPLLLLSVAVAIALGVPGQAQAQQDPRPQRAERGPEAARGPQRAPERPHVANQERRQDSMAESIRYVRRASRGQVLSAERMHSNGREINRIKVVDERGRVRVFEDDPQRRQGRDDRSRSDND